MQNTSNIRPARLPSSGRLVLATLAAIVAALILLLTAVLPAEYGIDPTGIGKKLGLTDLSNNGTPTSVNPSGANSTSNDPVWKQDTVYRTDTLEIELQSDSGTEIKAVMKEGERYFFHWEVSGGKVHVDMHGEEAGETRNFTSYSKEGNQTSDKGYFEAPFEGTHGWHWFNKGKTPVTITVTTAGYYEKLYQL